MRVYIASPFKGATTELTRQNIIYARLCMLDSLERGEAPYLSHLLYTQVWSEEPKLRAAGLAAGDAWREASEIVAVYQDLGVTPGMQAAIEKVRRDQRTEFRSISRLLTGCDMSEVDAIREALHLMTLKDWPELRRVAQPFGDGGGGSKL